MSYNYGAPPPPPPTQSGSSYGTNTNPYNAQSNRGGAGGGRGRGNYRPHHSLPGYPDPNNAAFHHPGGATGYQPPQYASNYWSADPSHGAAAAASAYPHQTGAQTTGHAPQGAAAAAYYGAYGQPAYPPQPVYGGDGSYGSQPGYPAPYSAQGAWPPATTQSVPFTSGGNHRGGRGGYNDRGGHRGNHNTHGSHGSHGSAEQQHPGRFGQNNFDRRTSGPPVYHYAPPPAPPADNFKKPGTNNNNSNNHHHQNNNNNSNNSFGQHGRGRGNFRDNNRGHGFQHGGRGGHNNRNGYNNQNQHHSNNHNRQHNNQHNKKQGGDDKNHGAKAHDNHKNKNNDHGGNAGQKPDNQKNHKKKRKTNTLGLTPGDESASDNDESEEKYLTEMMGQETLQITDLPAYIEDRRKNFPTRERVEAKKLAEEAARKAKQEEEEATLLQKQAAKLRRELRKVESSLKRKRDKTDEGDEMRQESEVSDSEPEEESSKANEDDAKTDMTRHCKYFSTGGSCGKKSKCRFVHDPAVRDAAIREKEANNGKMTIRQRLILNDKEQEDLAILESIEYLRNKGAMAKASIVLLQPMIPFPKPKEQSEGGEGEGVSENVESSGDGEKSFNEDVLHDETAVQEEVSSLSDAVVGGSVSGGSVASETKPEDVESGSERGLSSSLKQMTPLNNSLPQKPPLSAVPAGKSHNKRQGPRG